MVKPWHPTSLPRPPSLPAPAPSSLMRLSCSVKQRALTCALMQRSTPTLHPRKRHGKAVRSVAVIPLPRPRLACLTLVSEERKDEDEVAAEDGGAETASAKDSGRSYCG